jgi:hypothetical protein
MGTQVCFTADDKLLKVIDDLAENIERSRSDTVNLLLWLVTQSIKDKKPSNLGELFLSVSAGTAATFRTEPHQSPVAPPLPQVEVDMESLKVRWQRILQDFSGLGDPEFKRFFIDDKPRNFYIVKELASSVAPGLSRQTFAAVNEQMEAVKVEVEPVTTVTMGERVTSPPKVHEQRLENAGFDPIWIVKRVLQQYRGGQ